MAMAKKGAKKGARKVEEIEVTVAEVVDHLRLTGRFAPALREVVRRKVAREGAKKIGLKVTTRELQKGADAFRLVNRLTSASATNAWLRANGITVEALEDYLETNLLISKLRDKLEKTTSKKKYLASPGVKESVREMIYQEWLAKQLK